MHKALKNEFGRHSTLIFSSSMFDYAPKIPTRIEISSINVHFSAPC